MIIAILFSLAFVLNVFLINITELTPSVLVTPLICSAFFAILVTLFFRKILRSKLRGGLTSAIFLILFFSYEDFFWQLDNNRIKLPDYFSHVDKNYIAQLIWILLFITAFIFINHRSKGNFMKISQLIKLKKFLLIIAVVMFIFPLSKVFYYEINQVHQEAKSTLQLPKVDAKNVTFMPDIYYIMPEDYSSPSVMKKYFNYDNSSFVDFLKTKGFVIPENSTSNYPKTFESLASSLNMEYLDYLAKFKNSSDLTVVAPLIENNNALNFLKTLGYKYYQMGSWWEFTENNRYADENITLESENILGINNFSCSLLESTQIFPLINTLPNLNCDSSRENRKKRLVFQFNEIQTVAKKEGPKFVFLHVLAPHEPYVFGKNCSETTQKIIDSNEEYVNYANQANCIDKKMEEIVDGILKTAKQPPVIIIQSDEGAQFINEELNPKDNWKTASDDLLKEKFPIFNAYFLPGVAKNKTPVVSTPVNLFRIIFNQYFHTDFSILPDKNYIFSDIDHLYDFSDVTSRVNKK